MYATDVPLRQPLPARMVPLVDPYESPCEARIQNAEDLLWEETHKQRHMMQQQARRQQMEMLPLAETTQLNNQLPALPILSYDRRSQSRRPYHSLNEVMHPQQRRQRRQDVQQEPQKKADETLFTQQRKTYNPDGQQSLNSAWIKSFDSSEQHQAVQARVRDGKSTNIEVVPNLPSHERQQRSREPRATQQDIQEQRWQRHEDMQSYPEKTEKPAEPQGINKDTEPSSNAKQNDPYNLNETLSFITSFNPADVLTPQVRPHTKKIQDAQAQEDGLPTGLVEDGMMNVELSNRPLQQRREKEEQQELEQQEQTLSLSHGVQTSSQQVPVVTPCETPEQTVAEATVSLDETLNFIASFNPAAVLPRLESEDGSSEESNTPEKPVQIKDDQTEGGGDDDHDDKYADEEERSTAQKNLISEF